MNVLIHDLCIEQKIENYKQLHKRIYFMCPCCRLAIVTLTSSETVVADSSDSGVIHLAGFDSDTPEIIRLFALGELDSAPPG